MIKCANCLTEKTENNFYWKIKNKRRQSYCKPCLLTYQKDRWHERKRWAIEHKGGICVDCKQSYHPAAFQFHHLDPSKKEFSWNKGRLRSLKSVKKELENCILLCANCHFIRHSSYS
jgi:hypothetical protein